MSGGQTRADLFERLAQVGKALGNPKRLDLIELLVQGPRGVVELAAAAELGVTTTSAHLQTLKQAGLVASEREGTTIRYRVAAPDVAALFAQLLEVAAAHSAEVEAAARLYLGDEDAEQIDREELLRRAGTGEALVLDVRPALEYAAGHVPGAVSIPLEELADRLEELPEELEIVAYCRGAYCVLSHDAVLLLQERGRRAVQLAGGIVEWQAAGEPLAVTATA